MPDHLAHGVALFNSARFYDAHEALEDAWRESQGEARLFLQGLTQAAVALHHHSTGNLVGARSVLDRALRNLEPYADNFRGVQVAHLRHALRAFAETLDNSPTAPAYPKIELHDPAH